MNSRVFWIYWWLYLILVFWLFKSILSLRFISSMRIIGNISFFGRRIWIDINIYISVSIVYINNSIIFVVFFLNTFNNFRTNININGIIFCVIVVIFCDEIFFYIFYIAYFSIWGRFLFICFINIINIINIIF